MNILLIGNGFDLAHGLPTTYKDYLKFVKQIDKFFKSEGTIFQFKNDSSFKELDNNVADFIDSKLLIGNSNKLIGNVVKNFDNKYIIELHNLTKSNFWIEWLSEQDKYLNEKWIDIETEISFVIQTLEFFINNNEIYFKKFSIKKYEKFKSFIEKYEEYNKLVNSKEFKPLKKLLLNDLESLDRSLEIYLEYCVRNINKYLISPDIFNLSIDCILSFNYTDTFKRIYGYNKSWVQYEYIHGHSELNNNNTNLILGIDDYLNEEEADKNTDFIEFKKYFQRINKSTGNIYKKWLKSINESSNRENNLYIFGHSLDKTDKDILNEIILNKKIRTTIFYVDSNRHSLQISNLVKIIGKDNLISMTSGEQPVICFRKQKKILSRNSTNWQISRDIICLGNIETISNKEFNEIQCRIKQSIEYDDIDYFNNQKSIISLYNVLLKFIKNNNEIKKITKELYRIAKRLYKKSSENFDYIEWCDIDYVNNNLLECNDYVKQMVTHINAFNSNIKRKKEYKKQFDYNNLEKLNSQIIDTNISEITFKEIIIKLISLYNKDNIKAQEVHLCIKSLLKKFPPDLCLSYIKDLNFGSEDINTFRINKILNDLNIEDEFYQKSLQESDNFYDNII